MASHALTLDRNKDCDWGYAVKAFCSCGWSEDRWHHAGMDWQRIEAADEAAIEAGQDHRADAE